MCSEDPDISVIVSVAMTGVQALHKTATKSSQVPTVERHGGVDQMISLQKEDPAIQGLAGAKKAARRGNKTAYFEKIKGVIHLTTINAKTGAESLVDIYNHLGTQEEMLSVKGTQFMFDYRREVCRILGIKQKVTTRYHPMCIDLVRGFMPPSSHVFAVCVVSNTGSAINPLLFAYKEFL
ncbi:reverse transcriptase [Plakobranchus ocellatus]|uniref:Reverse transcriptase n=1 Tax=Plakobranchus ocellatus TaxID=259542 RepID=A0AAV4CY25_9GAST|nr:reverse transcriptase [Plakobranchus ocellatus]